MGSICEHGMNLCKKKAPPEGRAKVVVLFFQTATE